MRNWRQLVAVVSMLLFAGLANFNSVSRKPEFQTLPAIDVFQLLVTGMCIGAVVFATVAFLKRHRSR